MFKNTTRRGLAIGAAIAIAFSGLVTSPAQAAGEVVLAPSAGTAYNTFVTEDFTLQASLAPGQNSAQAQQLKYKIDKAAGATVSYGVSTSASVTTASGTLNAAATSVVVAADGAGALTQNFVKLAVTGATSVSATTDVTVTAFVDANNNGTLDTGEFATAQTVSFKKYSDVASAVALTQPAEGDTSLKGTASLTGINTNQVQKTVTFVASIGGTATGSATLASGVYSTAVSALAGAATVSAVVNVGGVQVGAASATLTVTSSTVKAITGSAVAGDNALNVSSGVASARLNSAFAVQANVKNSTSATAVAVAGAAVTAAVTSGATLSSTKTLSLNGTVYTTNASLPTALAVTSDASGNAVVNVVTVGFAASETITFAFTSQNLAAAGNLVVTQVDAAYTVKSVGVNNWRTVATSSAFAIDYTVADQFAVALPAGHRLVVAYDGTTKYVPVSGGAAKAEFTSTASATTLDVTNSGLEKQNTTTLNWATVSATTASAVAVKSTTVAAKFDSAPTHSATAVIARATTSNTAGYTNKVEIKGRVNHAGQSVKVTSTGAMFSTAAQDEKAVANTITTLADGNGYWTVSAYVVKAGAATVTYLAGTATASTTVTAGAAVGTDGTVLTIVSVDTILPGKTLVATLKLVDEHGNAVAADDAATESFAVTVTGLGFVGAIPTKLNASGEATVAVLLGSADEGSVVITATYDADGAGSKAAVTTTKTVAVAPAAASEVNAVVGSFNGRWAVRVENAKGSAVTVKVGGKWYKATATSDSYVFSRKSKVGATVLVKVWVAGDLQNEQTITVK